ncbi:MAG: sterol desaturase family protein [Elusimicrobia bacterium]|nr:sterol desaturase family protein [Elusimicrobiota bacterium]
MESLAARAASWRLPLFLGVLALMLAAETAWAVRPWSQGRARRLGFHLGLAAVNGAWTRLLMVGPLLAWTAYVHARGWGAEGLLRLTGWREVAAGVVALDLLNYWWHRLNHEVGFFWRFHRAHHVDTHVDTTTALRFHPGELLLSYGMKALWVLAWGPSTAALVVFEAALTAYAQFHHSNIDLPDRAERLLRLVHMTPRLHAAHHTAALRTRDMNYGTIFLWWDRLFGTVADATPEELATLGLPEGRASGLSPGWFLAAPARLGP